MARTYQVRYATSLTQLEAHLNQNARQGWRLSTALLTTDLGTTEHYIAIMERDST